MVREGREDETVTSTGRDREEEAEEEDEGEEEADAKSWKDKQRALIPQLSGRFVHGDLDSQIEAARDIRKLLRKSPAKNSARTKLAEAGVLPPLVLMLLSSRLDAQHAALLALLNLAVRNERNKVEIVAAGAVPPLIQLLKHQNASLRELATAAILTLSAAAANKPTLIASGAPTLLVQMLSSGTIQGRVDAVTALHNLSACKENPAPALDAKAVTPLISLLKECKKYSKFAEKATALLLTLSNSEEGRVAITKTNSGILTLVETVEDGSLISTEHAAGALLSLCMSCREKYRDLILKEGAIPGLLHLTVEGTPKARERARTLLDLLRKTPQEKKMASSVLEKIVYDIAFRVDGADKAGETAKKLLQDMVQRNMVIG